MGPLSCMGATTRLKSVVATLVATLVLVSHSLAAAQHAPAAADAHETLIQQHKQPHYQLARLRARCRGTRLRWCGLYITQKPLPAKLPPAFDKTCPRDCSGVGVCNAMSGMCDCPAGWTGLDCSDEQKRPCTAGGSSYQGPGTKPMSHIGPDKRDLNWSQGDWTASRCGGVCDDDKGYCYCDGAEFGRQPAAAGSKPGTPPVRAGRPIGEWCQPRETRDGKPAWGKTPYRDLYGSYGWCNVPVGVVPAASCGCAVDGLAGRWCEQVTEQFCPNSCSGHGRCDNGFCHCGSGWFGHDCAGRVEGQTPESAGDEVPALTDRPWLKGHLVPPPAVGATRRRPLMFVYDLAAVYSARMLQYRGPKHACVWRHFEAGNTTELNKDWGYPAETLLHELLLQSPHRTLDPEEADFFYVPAYTSCFMYPIHGWADYPWWYSAGGPRVSHMAKMLLELKQHIQQAHPYWNRTQGANHIWLASHDEGACWFPRDVYDTSIILTHWGRMDQEHTSNTAFPADNYTAEWFDPGHKGFEHLDWTQLYRGHPCYTPGKDLVIPSPKFPSHYRWSPLLGAPPQQRTILLYFRGDVGQRRLRNYSRGIRQTLYNAAKALKWRESYNIRIGAREDLPGDYSLHLASSKFCLVAPGDGFSPRAEDCILHGSIPVVIQDNVHTPFESILDWASFAVRVPEAKILDLPQILLAIPPERLQQMQLNSRQVWHRFAYLSQPLILDRAESIKQHWQQQIHDFWELESPESSKLGQPDWDVAVEVQEEQELAQQQLLQHGQGGYAHQASMQLYPGAPHTSLDEDTAHVRDPTTGRQQQRRLSGLVIDKLWRALGFPSNSSSSRYYGGSSTATTGSSNGTVLQHLPVARMGYTQESVEDDAFGTLMQWLYAKMLQQQEMHGHHKIHSRHQGLSNSFSKQ